MFLKNKSASGRFQFDEVYSCLQKSLRRGDEAMAIEMVKEFKQYPNTLKKRLIYDCCEDLPNLYLINAIFETKPEIAHLVKFIKPICEHIKCREVIMSFRVACTEEYDFSDLTAKDDCHSMTRKLMTQICAKSFGRDEDGALSWLIDQASRVLSPSKLSILKNFKLKQIYNFINKSRLVMFAIIAFMTIPYVTKAKWGILDGSHVEYVEKFEFTIEELPNYIYDKHVHKSPSNQKGYTFFIDNILLVPRNPKTQIEIEGEELYKRTNLSSGDHFIRAFPGLSNPWANKPYHKITDFKMIQTQLITGKSKPRTWFADFDGSGNFNYVIKGPLTPEAAFQQILSDKLKTLLNLVSMESESIILTNEENEKDISDELYILSKNLVTIDPESVTIKNSKLETNVVIYSGQTNVYSDSKFNGFSEERKLEFFKCLFFRKMIGANDTCCRNIICSNDTIATIDDPVLFKETDYMFKVPLNERLSKMYTKALKEQWEGILTYIKKVKKTISKNQFDLSDKELEFMKEKCDEMTKVENWNFGCDENDE